jgi:hypothetical protein
LARNFLFWYWLSGLASPDFRSDVRDKNITVLIISHCRPVSVAESNLAALCFDSCNYVFE